MSPCPGFLSASLKRLLFPRDIGPQILRNLGTQRKISHAQNTPIPIVAHAFIPTARFVFGNQALRSFHATPVPRLATPESTPAESSSTPITALAQRGSNQLSLETPRNNVGKRPIPSPGLDSTRKHAVNP
ncbi:hypothetical protein BOTBODRAFT_261504 [Botryobasidium botryosum FD-172 SS1]|uniref:Uncharacterized protein n=1 Tax=Botryobasidium botryosum (strain FD-172 SS1) TaxID=930990 RepID=A0A067MWY9_BOTB1|nr:hypothetical protein BOTBODRAFT_261504 [Botryobasidium botryosum FD-172 SS1]